MHVRLAAWSTLAVMLACPAAFAQRIASADRERVEAVLVSSDRASLPLIDEKLRVTIDGQHASTTLDQVFENTTGARTEGRYRLRAGLGAHVEGFAYWNGTQKIVGEVFEKQVAREVYENVTGQRRDPGLLEQEGEGAFGFRVFPIEASEKKRVELRWTKWLERTGKTVRYHAPITRADADIEIVVTGTVKNVASPTHDLDVEKTRDGIRLRPAKERSATELILEWDVDEPDWRPSLFVHAGGKHDGWFALALAAPQLSDRVVTPKDVTIVIDRSGSMSGEPMAHARTAAADMIRLLDARDRVNVVAFSDEVDTLFKTPRKLDEQTRAAAVAYAERLKEGGGTDIALALKTAIGSQDREAGRTRVVVFMTDGQSDVQQALTAAAADTGDLRMFTLGLGPQVNRALLERIANQKRGRFVYVDRASAIETEVGKLAASIAKPLLVDISLDVEGVEATRLYPRSIGDLFAEDELLVVGRMRGTGTAKLTIRGMLAGKPVAYSRSVEVGKAPPRPWVGRLWAQARVAHLLEEIMLGSAQNKTELENEVIELALAYNFVTPYTSFLAIPDSELGDQRGTIEAARERKRKIMVANADAASLSGEHAVDAMTMGAAPGGDADEESLDVAQVRRRGCAGCASSQPAGAGLLLGLLVLVLRRRRR
jgi:Ca-activated chloride channel family protein